MNFPICDIVNKMNTVAVSLSQPIGSTNIGVIPKIFLNNEIQLASETYVAEKDLGEALEKYENNGKQLTRTFKQPAEGSPEPKRRILPSYVKRRNDPTG